MNYKWLSMLAAFLLLVGCAAREQITQGAQSAASGQALPPTAEELGREAATELSGQAAALHIGQGYSLYILDEGWTLALGDDEGIVKETWKNDLDGDVTLTVYHYEDVSAMVARDRFTGESGYVFDESTAEDQTLYGTDHDGVCEVKVAEGVEGVTYVIAWEYDAGQEDYAAQLAAMAATFELME